MRSDTVAAYSASHVCTPRRGARASLAERETDHHGGAVPARAGARSGGAAGRRQARQGARPDRRGREQERRQRHHRLRHGRARGARRLHLARGDRRHACHRRAPDEEPALRSDQGFHAARRRGRAGDLPRGQQQCAVQYGRGIDRLRQGASGRIVVRLLRRRLRVPDDGRIVQPDRRRAHQACALSRRRARRCRT